jgi:3-oxoacyl-[acyl-carrier-protein] synthase II
MKRRVAITGAGVVSPVGTGLDSFWRALSHGESGVAPISRYDASGLQVRIAAEVRGFSFGNYAEMPLSMTGDDGTPVSFDRRTQFALAAAEMAVRDADLVGAPDWSEAGVYLGAGEGDNDVELLWRMVSPWASTDSGCDVGAFLGAARVPGFALHDQLMEPTMPAAMIACRFGITGEVSSCLTACAASAQAIGEAMRRIQSGECDLALAGGAHAMTAPLDVLGFGMLAALSSRNDEPTRASRPFDRTRDGFVLAEGAGIVVLEVLEHALRRGAPIYGELVGYGCTNDAYRVTDMHSEARGATRAITNALNDGATDPSEVGYVNAHGTSTIENDRLETRALHQALGEHAPKIPISSTKSMTGHAVAAAGAIELIATVLAMREQVVPPTINLRTPDPECDLDYVPNQARRHAFRTALSNSFGFGGQNVSLLVRSAAGGVA